MRPTWVLRIGPGTPYRPISGTGSTPGPLLQGTRTGNSKVTVIKLLRGSPYVRGEPCVVRYLIAVKGSEPNKEEKRSRRRRLGAGQDGLIQSVALVASAHSIGSVILLVFSVCFTVSLARRISDVSSAVCSFIHSSPSAVALPCPSSPSSHGGGCQSRPRGRKHVSPTIT